MTESSFDSIGLNSGDTGTLSLSGTAQMTVPSDFNVSDLTGSAGTVNIGDTATLKVNTLYVGKGSGGTGAGTVGVVNQTGGTLTQNTGTGEWRIGGGSIGLSAATGTYNLSGGTLSTNVNFQVGAYGVGAFNQSGGTFSGGGFIDSGRFAGSSGNISVTGGTFSQTATGARLFAGESGTGVISVGGTGAVTSAGGLVEGQNAGSSGTFNLNTGGTLTAATVAKGTAGTGTFNFNGGTLRPTGNDTPATAPFFTGVTANVGAGDAVIDTNGYTVTVASALVPAAVNGTGGLTKTGLGRLNLIAPNTFVGATTVNNGTLNVDSGSTAPSTAGSISATSGITVGTGGTLLLSGSKLINDRVNNSAPVTLSGGTFALAGVAEGGGGPGALATPGSVGVGALTLSASSVIDLQGTSLLHLADSSGQTWTGTLAIYNYSGAGLGGGASEQLLFGTTDTSLTQAQLDQISFYSDGGTTFLGTAGFAGVGDGEVVPVPEPATWLAGALTAGLLGFAQRRRLGRWLSLHRAA